MSSTITVVGNITNDPRLAAFGDGTPVCNFTVADNDRRFNEDTKEWEDVGATFYEVSVTGDFATNVAESLKGGTRVVVQGHLKARNWTSNDGEKSGTAFDLRVGKDGSVGPDLRWAQAQVTKVKGNGGQSQGNTSSAPAKKAAPAKQTRQPAAAAASASSDWD